MASPESPQVDLKTLFRAFSAVGLSGFGGVLPFARRMLVEERRWLSADEFNYLQGLCQFLPGPNVVNLSVVVGARYGGIGGALAAVIGLLSGPVAVVLLLVQFYDAFG
ncbi:MAG TPA: chromate transporter, partial [Azonexus sp.]|nr:chromate transporter [Azonexus sp.]